MSLRGEGQVLESWKEISAFLRRNIRTCQRWEEELGLPVHRLDGSCRARVLAYPDELKRWMEDKLHEGRNGARRKPGLLRAAAMLLPAGAAAFLGFAILLRNPQPVAPGPSGPRPKLAVLFFKNCTGDDNQEYHSQGFAADLVTNLQRSSPGLTALSPVVIYDAHRKFGLGETAEYSPRHIRSILERTRATHVLLGWYARPGDRWRIGYELRRAEGLTLMDAGRVEGGAGEQPAVMNRLAAMVLAAFRIPVPPGMKPGISCSIRAPEFYEMARNAERRFIVTLDEADLDTAVELFKRARDADPGCALARVGLGDAYQFRFVYFGKSREAFDLMLENYRTAFEMNPGLAETNLGQGWAQFFLGDNVRAFGFFRKAYELAPQSPMVNNQMGAFLDSIGLEGKAVEFLTRAVENGDQSVDTLELKAHAYEGLGDYEAAALDARRMLELEPTEIRLRCYYARILTLQGRLEEAEAELNLAETLAPGRAETLAFRGLLWAARGERLKALEAARMLATDPVYYTYFLSRIYASQGLADEALGNIEAAIRRSFDEHQDYTYSFAFLSNPSDRFFDGLRTDPRYLDILRRREAFAREWQARLEGL